MAGFMIPLTGRVVRPFQPLVTSSVSDGLCIFCSCRPRMLGDFPRGDEMSLDVTASPCV